MTLLNAKSLHSWLVTHTDAKVKSTTRHLMDEARHRREVLNLSGVNRSDTRAKAD